MLGQLIAGASESRALAASRLTPNTQLMDLGHAANGTGTTRGLRAWTKELRDFARENLSVTGADASFGRFSIQYS